jgi:hypothetical protein
MKIAATSQRHAYNPLVRRTDQTAGFANRRRELANVLIHDCHVDSVRRTRKDIKCLLLFLVEDSLCC